MSDTRAKPAAIKKAVTAALDLRKISLPAAIPRMPSNMRRVSNAIAHHNQDSGSGLPSSNSKA
jgi:hypothetical protein